MEHINYDSFYKFLTSLGIIIAVIPFAAVLFLFTDSFNLQISETDLVEYTKTAQDVIRLKQSIPLLVEKWHIWIIFAFILFGGIALTCIGMKKWYELQKLDDICKKRDADKAMETIRKNTVDMSDEQIIQKNTDDMFGGQNIQNDIYSRSASSVAMKCFLIEQKFFNLVKSTNRSRLVKCNIMIGDCEYDMVVFSTQLFEKDYVYEIKYMRKDITSGRIERYREQMKKLKQNFAEKLNRIPYMVLAIIVPDDLYEHTLNNVGKIEKWNNYSIEVLRESELPEM